MNILIAHLINSLALIAPHINTGTPVGHMPLKPMDAETFATHANMEGEAPCRPESDPYHSSAQSK